MRIGVDGTCWLNQRGYGRYTRQLAQRLVAQGAAANIAYSLIVDFDPALAPDLPSGARIVRAAADRPTARAAAADGRRSLADLWRMSRAISRERFDIVFFPTAYSYVPLIGPARIVVAIHDVIAEEYPRQTFPGRRAAALWRLKLLAARRQADAVVTLSEASRQSLARRFHIPVERIGVISAAPAACFRPLPADDMRRQVLARWGLEESRFILYVGGISPHKNLGALIEAFAGVRQQPSCADYRLVLVGEVAGDVFFSAHGRLREQIAQLGLAEAVTFTGYVPDEQLVHLYNAAAAFVLPSLLEGFGLPAVEALACGAPVVASARGGLPEVVGQAGLLFDPSRPGELGATLERLLTDPALQDRLRALGPRRAAEFSWDRVAAETLAAFQRVAGSAAGHAGFRTGTLAGKEVAP